jgi:serine/threonine protein kinase
MLTGRVPFSSDNEFKLMKAQIEEAPVPPRTYAPHISLQVEQAIMRSLAKKPAARFQTVAEFRAVLESSLNSATRPVEARPSRPVTPDTRIAESVSTSPDAAALSTTRLVPDQASAQASAATAVSQPKETRLAPAGTVQPAYDQSAYAQAPLEQAAQAPPSLLSKLSFVHYAGAFVLLAALVGVPFALMGSRSEQPAPQPGLSQPPPQQPAPQMPAAQQPVAPAQSQPVVQQSGPPAVVSQPAETKETTAGGQRAGASDSAAKSTKSGKKDSSDAAERERQRRREAALKALDN